MPDVSQNDLDDVPAAGRALSERRRRDFETIKSAGQWKQAVQAYLASISFADAQVGRLLSALDRAGLADDSVVVFWSDHGWHLGEKNHWHKSTLWEEATRVPFIVAAPTVACTGWRCGSPVSLVDIFPTLIDLCRLEPIASHDGESLAPLLRDPAAQRSRPAVTELNRGQSAVRSQRYRYIRYADGSEELYDHRDDPHERTNVAGDPRYAAVTAEHAKWAPTDWAEPAPRKDAYHFDPDTFTWTSKKTGKIIRGD